MKDRMQEPARALATVLFTDIVDSTKRASALGDREWRALLGKHHAIVRGELRRCSGREVTTTGDGFLAVFDQPESAILCACAIRDALRELGLEVRAGLHLGGVELLEKTVSGIAVHTASRVAALAGAGEVLVSSTVHEAVEGSGFAFEDRGTHALKGVPREWRLYAVTGLPAAAAELRRRARLFPGAFPRRPLLVAGACAVLVVGAALYLGLQGESGSSGVGESKVDPTGAASAAPGIAVLPFSVNEPSLDRWREGMVDLLSTNLDGAGGLRAIDSRTVLARWREQGDDAQSPDLAAALDVARRTGARYALLGSAVSSGSGMRLTADVYETQTGASLEAVQVEGSPDSVFVLVDRLSLAILRTILQGEQEDLPPVNLANVTTPSLPALKAYLEGEELFRASDFAAAIEAYQRAVAADSTFALAFYRLADAQGWKEDLWADVTSPYLERAARFSDRLPEREGLLLRAGLTLGQGSLEGIDLARLAAQRYPDDAEAWYLLGDAYYHLGAQALTVQAASDRPLSRAVELDPSLTPAHIHLIHNAFYRADSAGAAELIERYGRLAAGSEFDRANRLALRMAFGDSGARGAIQASLDTVAVNLLRPLVRYLTHPRFRETQEAVLREVRPRLEMPEGPLAAVALCWNHVLRGKGRSIAADLEDPLMPDWFRKKCAHAAFDVGMPIPAELLERELALGTDGAAEGYEFYAGAYAVDRGRWTDYNTVLARLREAAGDIRSGGDSTRLRFFEGTAQALEGYALWRRADAERALTVLQAAQKRATGIGLIEASVNDQIRFWLGRLCLETGRHREAQVYFESLFSSFGWDAPASYHLAKVQVELGEREKARGNYLFFIEAWKEADPELQPIVEEARKAVANLEG